MDLKAGSLSALIDLSRVQLTKGTLSHKELVYYGFKPMLRIKELLAVESWEG